MLLLSLRRIPAAFTMSMCLCISVDEITVLLLNEKLKNKIIRVGTRQVELPLTQRRISGNCCEMIGHALQPCICA